MKNIQLSKNFSLNEMIKSNTAIRHGIKNIPSKQEVENLKNLVVFIWQPVRDALGKPIVMASGFRCKKLNTLIGGANTSQHVIGEAGDGELLGASNAILFNYIKDNLEFDQLIWEFGDDDEPEWVHASYTTHRKNRKEVLKAVKIKGKTKYIRL